MKKIASMFLGLSLLLALAACGGAGTSLPAASPGAGSAPADSSPNQTEEPQGGASQPATGDGLGETHSTIFFEFTVLSAQRADSYAGLTATEGNQLIDVVIATTNTFGSAIVMIEFDYQLQWGDGSDPTAFRYPLDAQDGTMAPLEFELADGERMEYHYVYEAPADVTVFEIAYEEAYIDADGNEGYGDVFIVPFNVL